MQQNWMITQGCDSMIYIANTEGILIYNGFKWQKVILPRNQKPRSIYKGEDCNIYVGAYETFGYIDRSEANHPKYIPIVEKLLEDQSQEIWNIFGNKDQIIFQSFSNIYNYQNGQVSSISVPSNIMLGTNIGEDFYLPKIQQGLYQLRNNKIETIAAVDQLPKGSKIAGLAAYKSGIVLGTQYQGIFVMVKNNLLAIKSALNETLKKEQINKILQLKNGDYVVGTILNGIYVTTDFINIKYHISKSNGLTNNTILSLFSDNLNGLWIGTDYGLNYLKIQEPIAFFYDRQGKLGSIYTAINYQDHLYLGTNQGVFKSDNLGNYNLVENSQGQIWSFLKIDGDLLCGHNSGTFLITEDKFERISDITGGWCMRKIGANKVLQSTYTGLVILNKKNGKWSLDKRIKNGGSSLAYFEIQEQNILGFHKNEGLSLLKLSSDYNEVIENIGVVQFPSNPHEPQNIYSNQQGLFFSFRDSFFIWKENEFKYIDEELIQKDSTFNRKHNFYRAVESVRKTEQLNNYQHVETRNEDGSFLVGIDEGYMLIPVDYGMKERISSAIELDYLIVNGKDHRIQKDIVLGPRENNITIAFADFQFGDRKKDIFYRLKNWDEAWRRLPDSGVLNFININDGNYELQLKTSYQPIRTYLTLEIKPHWYETWPGALLYCALGIFLIFLLNKRNKKKLLFQEERLQSEKIKELETERMKSTNEKLKHEIRFKSKMLANSTLAILQKNKMLDELKKVIVKDDFSLLSEKQYKQRILHLINRNVNSDEDWEIFEQNFAAVHHDFLEKLKLNYPNITAGELRLAAYIRMNLSSKEIAPLLYISYRSVENKRYRLRKKMGLAPETNLSDHLLRL